MPSPVPAEEATAVSDQAPVAASLALGLGDAAGVSPLIGAVSGLTPAAFPAVSGRSCRAELSLAFADASPSPTIHDPIKLAPHIAGVAFRHQLDKTPRYLWVDCQFALRLQRAAEMLHARDVTEVVHVGTYEPKSKNGTLSAHALGMAIDVVSFVRNGETISVEKDFVRRGDKTPTCLAPRIGPRDEFLKSVVCALDGTFNALLTPNWDDKHRTHFHLALHKPSRATWANGVDPRLEGEASD